MTQLFEVSRNIWRGMARAEVLRKQLKEKKVNMKEMQDKSAALAKTIQSGDASGE